MRRTKVALAAGALSACGRPAGVTINLFVSPENNLQHVVDVCTATAGGRYRIVYHKLPRAADGQREQMVRRLAAKDPSLDVLGLDVTWVPEFAEAGWVVPWTGAAEAEATRVLKTLTTAGVTDPSLGNADPGSTMAAKFPMKPDILAALADAAVRPLTPAYQNLSTVISKVLSPPSAIDPRATAAELRERLTDALNSRDIIP